MGHCSGTRQSADARSSWQAVAAGWATAARPAHPSPPTDPAVRVGDAERDAVVTALSAHVAAGRLDPAEHEQRVAAALAAVRAGDLQPLLADLPPLPPSPSDRAPQGGGLSRGHRAALVAVVAPWALVCAGLWLIWLLTTPGGYPWPVWPMFGWGIGVAGGVAGVLRDARTRGGDPAATTGPGTSTLAR